MNEFFTEVILPVITILVIVLGAIGCLCYYSAYRESEIYNSQNHTSYTASDFFWAGDQINSNSQTIKVK